MIYVLWGGLMTVIVTGLAMTGARSPVTIAEEKAAVAAGDWSVLAASGTDGAGQGGEARKLIEDVHETAANLLLLLALVHVAGVVVESRSLKRNLVRPMIFGRTGKQ